MGADNREACRRLNPEASGLDFHAAAIRERFEGAGVLAGFDEVDALMP